MNVPHYRLSVATASHKGDRAYQQDKVEVLQHPYEKNCFMVVVADGMGGRSGGRKASDQVMMTARQLFERYSPETDDATSMLKNLVNEAHIVIRLTAISAEQEPHTTMAAFLINPGGECHWVHAGDSRLYHFRGATLVRPLPIPLSFDLAGMTPVTIDIPTDKPQPQPVRQPVDHGRLVEHGRRRREQLAPHLPQLGGRFLRQGRNPR